MLDSLSPVSKAMLDLSTVPGGYEDLKPKHDTLGLWQLIKATHLGVSVRAKQQSLLDLLAWKQTDATFPEDLSMLRNLMDSFLANYESPPASGNILAEVLFRQIFLSGIRPAVFQREIDNAYDQHADKSTSQLMEICQLVHLERGGDVSRASFVPQAMVAPVSGAKTRAPLSLFLLVAIPWCPLAHFATRCICIEHCSPATDGLLGVDYCF